MPRKTARTQLKLDCRISALDKSQYSSGTPELSSSPLKESLPLPLTVEDFYVYLRLHIKAWLASWLVSSLSHVLIMHLKGKTNSWPLTSSTVLSPRLL